MKMYLKFLLLSVVSGFLSFHTLAQRNNQWMLGETGKLDFSGGSAQFSLFGDSIYIRQTTAGICDTNGIMLFWTNGGAIFQANRDSMQNGLLYNLPFSQFYAPLGLIYYQSAIALPSPAISNEYYLFHISIENYPSAPVPYRFIGNLYYSVINMSANGGLGSVTQNSLFVEDSIQLANITAVKHANGRDWWIISHELASDRLLVWLLSPQGLSPVSKQTIGISSTGRQIGQMAFSPDGSLFSLPITNGSNITSQVMDFDRCSGTFGSVLKSEYFLGTQGSPYTSGSQFSPSQQFLYLTNGKSLFQYDLTAPNFANSRVLIDDADSSMVPFPSDFVHLLLAPDGKIYCHHSNGNQTMHVINQPDSVWLTCNFVQNQFYPSNPNARNISGLPNFPNYDLGPLVGSPCDTLTSLQEPVNAYTTPLRIFPNPAITQATFNYQLKPNQAGTLTIYNILGEAVFENTLLRWSSTATINLNLPAGIYQCVVQSEGSRQVGKLMVGE